MKGVRIFTIVAVLALGGVIKAQHVMTLRECMETAIKNSTKAKIQRADNDDAQIGRRDAILDMFTPRISGEVYTYSNYGRTVDPETNTYNNTSSFMNGYSVGASIMLFNGFSAVNNLRISKTAVRMGISQEQKLYDDICLATMEAYYNVVYFGQMKKVQELHLESVKGNLQLVRRQYELGQKGYADVVQIEADVADAEYRLVDMENRFNDALLTLKDIMLMPLDEEMDIDMSVAENTIVSFHEEEQTETIASYAKMHNPLVLVAKGKLDNARLELNTARGQFLPSITLSGGWSTSYYTYPGLEGYMAQPFGIQMKNNGGEFLQLNLSIPIYDRLSRCSNLARKKNSLRRASAEYEQTLRDVESEIARAVQDCRGAATAYMHARKRLEVQSEAYSLNERKMQQGLVSMIEFKSVANDWLNAKAEELNAMLLYCIKESVVKYYKGTSYLEQY